MWRQLQCDRPPVMCHAAALTDDQQCCGKQAGPALLRHFAVPCRSLCLWDGQPEQHIVDVIAQRHGVGISGALADGGWGEEVVGCPLQCDSGSLQVSKCIYSIASCLVTRLGFTPSMHKRCQEPCPLTT